jgi:4-hydroxybenzoate polyprenyltransferase/phosphoserine phosphatase
LNSSKSESTLRPLVIDLDGTLIKSDTLFESANQYLLSRPDAFLKLTGWLIQGKSVLKNQLAQKVNLEPETLPFRQEVIEFIKKEKLSGRTIVLATASSEIYAKKVSAYLELFDEVLASTPQENLKGSNKAKKLIELFGDKGFDYVGDSAADVLVWQHSHTSYMISPQKGWIDNVSPHSIIVSLDFPRPSISKTVNKTFRIHQWVKNLLIFLPLLVTHQFGNAQLLATVTFGFIAFSLSASAIYVLNDLIDISNDRLHPSKRNRSIASGNVSLVAAWASWPFLLLISLLISFILVSELFGFVIVGYILLTTLYSLRLKKIAVIDVIALAILYTTRIIAGAVAIQATPSMWILSFSLFFFFSLALMKRYSELLESKSEGKSKSISGRGYNSDDLELVSALGAGSGLISVLIFVLYIHDPNIANMYQQPILLWLGGVVLLIWISRAWLIAHRGLMHEDPIVFALKDKPSYWLAATLGLVFLLAMVL